MKRLIQKEAAKQVGTLYHYTSLASAINILSEDNISSSDVIDENGSMAISFTRNKNFHNGKTVLTNPIEVRLVIDGDKLSNNYKIKPHNDYAMCYKKTGPGIDEQEERVTYTPKDDEDESIAEINPISPYVVSLDIIGECFPEEEIRSWKSKLPFMIQDSVKSLDGLIEYMQSNYNVQINLI